MPPESEAQAWWADVQHVRETIERRRAGAADSSADAAPRFTRIAPEPLPTLDEVDWLADVSGGAARHADHTARARTTEPQRTRSRDAAVGHPGRRAAGPHDPSDRFGDAGAAPVRSAAVTASATSSPPATTALSPPPARRTVQITGRTVAAPPLPRLVEVERRRPAKRPVERVGPRPDRIALWAVLLGFFLILVAATSSHAATRTGDTGAPAALHAPAR